MRTIFLLARLLVMMTAGYLLFVWLGSGRIDLSFLVLGAATLVLFAGVLRRPRRSRLRWLLPATLVFYAFGVLVALALHLRLGLPTGERPILAALLIVGLALAMRGIYQATRPVRLSLENYFDRPSRSRSRG